MCESCVIILVWSVILIYVFCYLFFFKQKTAYEMRISDWSSDVCSSDLLRNPDYSVRDCGASLHQLAAMPSCRQPGIAAYRLFGKIGRASCRERVCQYV